MFSDPLLNTLIQNLDLFINTKNKRGKKTIFCCFFQGAFTLNAVIPSASHHTIFPPKKLKKGL